MVKLFLSDSPFLRLVVPYIFGIWLFEKMQLPAVIYTGISIVLFLLYAWFIYYYQLKPKYSLGFVAGVLMTIFMMSFGFTMHSLREPTIIDRNEKEVLKVQVRRSIGETDKNYKYEVQIINISDDSISSNTRLKGIIYLSKRKQPEEIAVGSILNISGRLLSFEHPSVPYQFDYSGYLKNNRIAFRMIVSDHEFQINERGVFDWELYLLKFKEYLNKRFKDHGLGQQELAILNAMFLGDKHQLSLEQKQAFTGAGAMHLLAVSGLHVGIIYLLISWFFRLLVKNKVAIFVCVFIMLWLYALLTGFSASVLRATIMFSVIEIGKFSQRRINIINLLSVSMFLILLIDPLYIYSVGFWLSHCAVASIVLFYPYFNRFFHFSFPPFRWLWSIMALSITAQIGAMPISLMTFHQFPVFFIFTNWLLIPIVTPVLILALLGAVLSPVGIVLHFIIPALNDLLEYMNDVSSFIHELPYSSITHIPFTWWQMLIFYSLLIAILIRIETQTLRSLRLLLLIAILFVTGLHLNRFLTPNVGLITVGTGKGTIVNYFNPDVNEVYIGSKLTSEEAKWLLSGLWLNYGVNAKPEFYQKSIDPDSVCNIKMVNGKSILIVRGVIDEMINQSNFNFDFMVNVSHDYNVVDKEEDGFNGIMLYGRTWMNFDNEKNYELKP